MKKLFTSFLTLAFAALFFTTFGTQKVEAQDFGADVASSYVWRGTQFGNGPHVQPWMSLGYGNLELGAWGSVPLTAGDGGTELDLYVSYDLGPLALTVTNYTFPNTFPASGGAYVDGEGLFEGDYLEVSGSGSVGPIDLTVGYFTELEALYIEAGFSIGVVDVAIGYAGEDDSNWYVSEAGLCNISVGGSKEVKITDDYSLPLFGSLVYNPEAESAFLVFGMSF
ncbi:MAG: hypothetical protein CMD11_00160 [Flavobacteriales bacterium]|nr:hypothetical protein [Flavobacteriales bacterium]